MVVQHVNNLPFEQLVTDTLNGKTGGWHGELIERALKSYAETGWPGQKTESWKYTSLNKLASSSFSLTKDFSAVVPEDMVMPLACPRLVLVNGVLNRKLSNIEQLNGDLSLTSLVDIKDHQKSFFDDLFQKEGAKEGLPLTYLNTGILSDAVLLDVAEGSKCVMPLHIISIGSGNGITFAPRLIVNVGEGARVDIIESHVGCSNSIYFSNAVTQIYLSDKSKVGHYKLQNDSRESSHIGLTKAVINEAASYDNFTMSVGGKLSRNEVRAHLKGSGVECCINGAYLGSSDQHIDNTTFIEHRAEGSSSREVFKGVLDDTARGVFQGKILVHREAQKTDGYQMNRAMLLSDKAEIDSKPELEIYADDVRCSHGATVGELEDDLIFYLCARGIDRESARRMLIGAYISDAIDEVKNIDVRASIQNVAENWLKQNLYEK